MRSVSRENTGPEKVVRSLLHKMGYRFRLHRKDLPGSPDIVLPKYKTVIFVHGCFWHQHPGCKKSRRPKSNTAYWDPKLDKNINRDIRQQEELKDMGWKVLIIWECQILDEYKLKNYLGENLAQHLVGC